MLVSPVMAALRCSRLLWDLQAVEVWVFSLADSLSPAQEETAPPPLLCFRSTE